MSTSIDELDVEREPGPPPSGKFYGKYRGTVVNNIDPLQIGRIMVIVPDVLNVTPGSWALPCVPVAGIQMGMFTVPPPGAGVWVEFEQGDPDFPIWVGCFWGTMAEVPLNAKLVPLASRRCRSPPCSRMVLQSAICRRRHSPAA